MKNKRSSKAIVYIEKNDRKAEEVKENRKNAYHVSWFDKIPYWIKAVLLKYWSCGMVYFFFVMGLGVYFMNTTYDPYLVMLIVGVAMGFINDFVIYNILVAMDTDKNESRFYMMFKSKKVYSLLINIPYGIVWAFVTGIICALLVTVIPANEFGLFREPLTYGVIGLAVDAIFVFIKDVAVYYCRKITHKEVI